MFQKIKTFFDNLRLKRLVKYATSIIYSRKGNLFEILQKEFIKDKSGYDLLIRYIAIKIAAELIIPVEKYDIENGFRELNSYDFNSIKSFEIILNLFKAKAELSVKKKEWDLTMDRNSYEQDNYSWRGMTYYMSFCKQRPLTMKEREYVKKSYYQIKEAKEKVEELEKIESNKISDGK